MASHNEMRHPPSGFWRSVAIVVALAAAMILIGGSQGGLFDIPLLGQGEFDVPALDDPLSGGPEGLPPEPGGPAGAPPEAGGPDDVPEVEATPQRIGTSEGAESPSEPSDED